MEKKFGRIDNSKDEYLSKNITLKFLFGALRLNVFSEYRQNDEWKHFVTLDFLWRNIFYVCFRTGAHGADQDMYFPQLVVGDRSFTGYDWCAEPTEKDNRLVLKDKNFEVEYTYGGRE